MKRKLHRLVWTPKPGAAPETWLVSEGCVELPPAVAQSLQVRCVVILGEWAACVGHTLPRGFRPLVPHKSVEGQGGATLRWRPFRAPVPVSADPTQARHGPSAAPTDFCLTSASGSRRPIGDDALIIGRRSPCDVVVDDPRVSQCHVLLRRNRHGVDVVDLRSKNGTLVDGTEVATAWVTRPCTLELGNERLRLEAARERPHATLPSAAMTHLRRIVERVAKSPASVCIRGETGSGKEEVARLLHAQSGRPGRFVALNAAALNSNLSGSQLFGHVEGSFTGAHRDHDGAFIQAHGGTLFLDEVAELPLPIQAELLRVLESRCVRRIGDTHEQRVDVRVVTASHQGLPDLVRRGAFREDLLHRLAVIPIEVPPLRERPEDIEAIAVHALMHKTPPRRLTKRAIEKLARYSWPGNIRELINTLERACVLSDELTLGPADIQVSELSALTRRPFDHVIHEHVMHAYQRHNGDSYAVAKQLGLRQSTVLRHVKQETGDA